jgi:hypothetical protein
MKRSPTGILVAVETQMASAEESWCHWVKDFPPQRESVNAWCLSCPLLVVSRERERRTLKKARKMGCEMVISARRRGYL